MHMDRKSCNVHLRGPSRRRTFSGRHASFESDSGCVWVSLTKAVDPQQLDELESNPRGDRRRIAGEVEHISRDLFDPQDPEHATPLFPPSFDCEFLFTALCVLAEAALRTSLLTTPGVRAIFH